MGVVPKVGGVVFWHQKNRFPLVSPAKQRRNWPTCEAAVYCRVADAWVDTEPAFVSFQTPLFTGLASPVKRNRSLTARATPSSSGKAPLDVQVNVVPVKVYGQAVEHGVGGQAFTSGTAVYWPRACSWAMNSPHWSYQATYGYRLTCWLVEVDRFWLVCPLIISAMRLSRPMGCHSGVGTELTGGVTPVDARRAWKGWPW